MSSLANRYPNVLKSCIIKIYFSEGAHRSMFEKSATGIFLLSFFVKIHQLFSQFPSCQEGFFNVKNQAVREAFKVGQLVWRTLNQMTFCFEICVVEVADAASKSDGVWTHFSSIRHKLMISPFD